MPKTLLNSVKIKSVPFEVIIDALKKWSLNLKSMDKNIVKIGYFGSYATGDYTPASDLDILIIIKNSDKPFWRRSIDFDTSDIPVGCDIFCYTENEIEKMIENNNLWIKHILDKTVFL